MQILTITTLLTISSVILTSNSEQGGSIRSSDRDDRSAVWSRRDDRDDWNNSGKWRRDHGNENGTGRRGRDDRSNERNRRSGRGRERDREREREDRRNENGRGRPEYEENDGRGKFRNVPKQKPQVPNYPISGSDPIKFVPPFFPFPTEPSMPSIIEPYPVIDEVYAPTKVTYVPSYVPTEATPSYKPTYAYTPSYALTDVPTYQKSYAPSSAQYYSSDSDNYSQIYVSSKIYIPSITTAYSNAYTSLYRSIPIPGSIVKKIPGISYYSNSSSTLISYDSTYIKTEAESTVTIKVTGRYRAMSNSSSSSSTSNLAGSISFLLVLLSSLFLLILV